MSNSGDEIIRDRRWALRRSIELAADLTDTTDLRCAITVTEISEEGCAIHISPGQVLGRDRLHTIKITGLDALSAYVIWFSDGKAGLTFSESLHPDIVRSLVTKSHYAKISRHMAKRNGNDDYLPSLPPFPFET